MHVFAVCLDTHIELCYFFRDDSLPFLSLHTIFPVGFGAGPAPARGEKGFFSTCVFSAVPAQTQGISSALRLPPRSLSNPFLALAVSSHHPFPIATINIAIITITPTHCGRSAPVCGRAVTRERCRPDLSITRGDGLETERESVAS